MERRIVEADFMEAHSDSLRSNSLVFRSGSLLMHGTHTTWGQWADWLSMIVYFNSMASQFIYYQKLEREFIHKDLLDSWVVWFPQLALGTGLGINFNFGLSIVITEVLKSPTPQS